MPPASPMLPGAYDFARAAWFMGLSATGSVLAKPEVLTPMPGGSWLGRVQRSLSRHVRERLGGTPGRSPRPLPAASVARSWPQTKMRCAMQG
ncbi:hypothetical protein [Novosphingobium sp. Gsoil 351]|uniref:hypothetical protein n=1 Tax=Novosphingobium sp. Gsoil 351 TaxID=2675225 RepID=UPI0012B4A78B|nr:hypothetical protein [Novosphingobium sp. Gsoil 351]QGN53907.1 hypothetical protein GKE62_04515 [Novosphingobium sp. Gsoil 351]